MEQAIVSKSINEYDAKQRLEKEQQKSKASRFSKLRKKARSRIGRSLLLRKRAKRLQKQIHQFNRAPWLLAYTAALAKDVLDVIPVLGLIMGPLFGLYIIYFTWRLGAKKERLFFTAFLLADIVPILGILPISSCLIFFLHNRTKKRKERAVRKLKHMGK